MTIHHAKKPVEVHTLGVLHLYREDLEKIARVIQDECANLYIEFHDESQSTGNEPSDFATIADRLPERIPHITMSGRRDEVVIAVELGGQGHGGSSVAVTSPDNSARGAAHAITAICKNRRAKLTSRIWRIPRRFGLSNFVVLLSYGLGIIVVTLSIAAAVNEVQRITDNSWILLPVSIILSALIVSTVVLTLGSHGGTIIINAPRALRPSHWQRHRITYVSNIITLLVGGIIGYVINQLPPWR